MDNKRLSVVSLQIDEIKDTEKAPKSAPNNIDNRRLSVASLQADDFRPPNVRESRTQRPSMISISIADEDETEIIKPKNNRIDNKRLSVVSLQEQEDEVYQPKIRESRTHRPSMISISIADEDDERDLNVKRSNSQIQIDTRRLSVASLAADEAMPIRKPNPKTAPNVRESRTQRPSLISITAVEEEFEEHHHAIAQQIDNKRLSVVSLNIGNVNDNDVRELNEKRRSVLCDENLQNEIKAQKEEKFDSRPTGRTSVLISNTSRTSFAPSIVVSENIDDTEKTEQKLEEESEKSENDDDENDGYKGFKNSIKKSASRESRVSCVSRVSMMSRTSMLSNAGLTSTDACGGAGVPVLNFDLKKAREMAQRSGSVMSISAEDKKAILAKRRKSSNVSVTSRRSIARYKRNQEKRKQQIGTYSDKKDNTMTLLNYDEHINTEKNDMEEEEEVNNNESRTSVLSQFGKYVGGKLKGKSSMMSFFGDDDEQERRDNERRNTEEFIMYQLEKRQEEEDEWKMYNMILGAGIGVCFMLLMMEHKYSKQAGPFSFILFLGLVYNNFSRFSDKFQDKREMRANRRITHARQSVIGRNSTAQGGERQRQQRKQQVLNKNARNKRHRQSMTLSQALSNV